MPHQHIQLRKAGVATCAAPFRAVSRPPPIRASRRMADVVRPPQTPTLRPGPWMAESVSPQGIMPGAPLWLNKPGDGELPQPF